MSQTKVVAHFGRRSAPAPRRTFPPPITIWNAGLFGGNADAWEKGNESFLSAKDKVDETVERLEICVGDQDFALAGSKAVAGVLGMRGI